MFKQFLADKRPLRAYIAWRIQTGHESPLQLALVGLGVAWIIFGLLMPITQDEIPLLYHIPWPSELLRTLTWLIAGGFAIVVGYNKKPRMFLGRITCVSLAYGFLQFPVWVRMSNYATDFFFWLSEHGFGGHLPFGVYLLALTVFMAIVPAAASVLLPVTWRGVYIARIPEVPEAVASEATHESGT